MKKIYAIRNDDINYKELDLALLDVIDAMPEEISLPEFRDFSINNMKMKEWWVTPETKFIHAQDDDAPIPDISEWSSATLVFSPKAYRLLSDTLKDVGEFLPVKVYDETYYIFNCLTYGETDDDKCDYEYEGDIQLGIRHLEFSDTAIKNVLFKTPLESCATVFCNDRFKEIVESFELTGVVFDDDLITLF